MGAALRRIQLGNALSAFGSGFTVPYLYVYVAKVRDLGASTAGAVLAMLAVAALVVLPLTGRVIDRRGPLPVAVIGSVCAAIGSLGIGLSASEPLVIAAAIALGAGIAVIQPALATMIVWCSTTVTRSRAFATQFFLNNLGLGVGGLVGGLLVDESHASSFVRLFAIEAVMFLVLGAAVATVRLPRTPKVEDPVPTEERAKGAWRAMFADRRMVWLCVLGFVLFFACYGQFESGLAAYATEVTRIPCGEPGDRARGQYGGDRGGAVRGAQAGRAPAAQPGDGAGRDDLDRGVDSRRAVRAGARRAGGGDDAADLDVCAVRYR